MDWSRFSNDELEAITKGNWSKVSTPNLEYYVGQGGGKGTTVSKPVYTPKEESDEFDLKEIGRAHV